jgi:deoxyhypusine synthase
VLGFGAHAVKVGLSRLIIDLLERGWLQGVAGTGAVAIHDLEMAYSGQTSEEVAEGLPAGTFGMAEETGRAYWDAVSLAARVDYGLGQALGRLVVESGAPNRDLSVLAAAYERDIPATLHVAVGADITHMRPSHDGAALGLAAFRDFQVFSAVVSTLDDGGVYVNLGSAVVLPEVFLKAVNISRNITGKPHGIVTADLDMIRHYRPGQNVVFRPTIPDGIGYRLTGHHEILFPLLYSMVRSRLETQR